jgi:TRAP-type mannitol/chloroaromatic compound transport system substrate-binding protein
MKDEVNRIFPGFGFLLALLAIVLAGCGPQAEQVEVSGHHQPAMTWKVQSYWQSGTLPQEVFENFTARVGVLSGGRLQLEPLAVNMVVSPIESLDAVAAGVIEAQHGGIAYFTGKDAAFALLGDPQGGFETPYQMQKWMEYGGGNELARELYGRYGGHFVGGVWYGQETLISKRPIRTLEQFRGVKIRAPQGIGQDIFQRLGAAPVNLPGSEVYTALERGVVDAADWGTLSMNEDLGYHRLAPYPTYPGFHSMPMADIVVNMRIWRALPDDLKAIVESAVRDFAIAMVQRNELADLRVARKASQLGFEPVDFSEEDRRKFREISRQVWQQYAGRSPMAQRIYDSQVRFMRDIGLLD